VDLTIIIVNWNGGDLILRCLESIRATHNPFKVKVIVVDNDSRDGSREAAQKAFPEYHIVNSGSNLGFGRANNFARNLVDTPLVLILNPDTELLEDTLRICVAYLTSHPEVGALGCQMLYPDGQVQAQGLQWFPTPWTIFLEHVFVTRNPSKTIRRWLPTIDPNKSGHIEKLYGGCVFATKDVLDRAGWFDDRYFMYAEDVDLSRTIRDMGLKLYYCAEARIIHVAGGTSVKAPSGFSILMKNESINKLIRKYQGAAGGWLHRAAVFFGSAIRLALFVPAWLIAMIKGHADSHSWSGSALRLRLSMLWALGLKRPFVVTSADPAGQASIPR
jgi:GT2 family glycosyltransferase